MIAQHKGLGDYNDLALGTQIAAASGPAIGAGLVLSGAVLGPVGMAIGAGVTAIAAIIGMVFKPDTDKIYATKIVDAVEPYMKQNLQAYQMGSHTKSEQIQALANFDYLWSRVIGGCQGQYGSAGVNCIGDRQRGGKWDWYSYYRDPIANDPNVVDDTVTGQASAVLSQIENNKSLWPLLLGAGLILFGVTQA